MHDNLGSVHPLSCELRKFRTTVKMMTDTCSAETRGSMVDGFTGKEDIFGYASGGCKSEDGKLSCGYSSFQGKRSSMEDFFDVKMNKISGKTVCLFGIFDGHGGSCAAEYLKLHLFENLMKHPQFLTDTKLAMSAFRFSDCCILTLPCSLFCSRSDVAVVCLYSVKPCYRKWACETYKKTDMDFLDAQKDTFRDDGSTASTAILVDNHLYVANVGDSRTVISKAGKAIPLSEDHKPNRQDERERIENAGGFVMWAAGVDAQFLVNCYMTIDIKVQLGLQAAEVDVELKLLGGIQEKFWSTSFDNYKSEIMWWDASRVAVVFVCVYLLLIGMLYWLKGS